MASFGDELKRERELREISLREVAETTKISVRHLEALECNDFESLPEGVVFRKGYVRAYCEYIGIDPESMLNAYLLEQRAREERGTATDTSVMRGRGVRAGVAPAAPPARGRGALWIALTVVLLAAIAVTAYWLWIRNGSEATGRSADLPQPPGAVGIGVVDG